MMHLQLLDFQILATIMDFPHVCVCEFDCEYSWLTFFVDVCSNGLCLRVSWLGLGR